MNAKSFFSLPVLWLAATMLTFPVGAEDKPPSFWELAEYRFRYPETDTEIDLYVRSWRNSHQHIGHGGFIEREVFFAGDPLKPVKQGTLLSYIKEYNHGVLNPRCSTVPTTHEHEQVFFFVTQGQARVASGNDTAELTTGSFLFVPAGVEYRFTALGDVYLHVIVITEEISADFTPARKIVTGHYRDTVPDTGWQWAFDFHRIAENAGFQHTVALGVAAMNRFDMSHPYVAKPGTEEIWYQVQGTSTLFLGNKIRTQHEGEAYYVPPNGKVPHASINESGEPLLWLYLCIRGER